MTSEMKKITDLVKQGRRDWLELYNDFSISNTDYVCLLPYYSREFTYYSIIYLKQYIEQSNQSIYVFTDKEIVIEALAYLDVSSIYKSEDTINSLLSYYNLYMFTDKLIVLSPTKPNGRTAFNLVTQGIIDVEEFISVGILQNRNFKRAQRINYDGCDEELVDFFGN